MLRCFDTLNDLLSAVWAASRERPRRLVLRGTLAPAANRAVVEMAASLGMPVVMDARDVPDGHAGDNGPLRIVDSATPAAADLVVLTDESGEAVHTILMDYVDQPATEILCRKTSWHYTRRPLLFASVPKSGTHLALALILRLGYQMFRDPSAESNRQRGVFNELLRDRQLGEHIVKMFSPDAPELPGGFVYPIAEPSYHMPFTRLFEVLSGMGIRETRLIELPILFSYRNPLGVLVSEAWAYRDPTRHIMGYYFSKIENTEDICHDLVRGVALTSIVERLAPYAAWLRMDNVIPMSFEELVGAEGGGDADVQRRLIWSVQLKLQIPGDPAHYASTIYDRSSATFRRGRLDAFRDELSDCRGFVAGYPELGQLCEDFDYGRDGSPVAPWPRSYRERRRRRLTTGTTPIVVARPGATAIWSAGTRLAALPAAFEAISGRCIQSSALEPVRAWGDDLAGINAAVRSPEVQRRHGKFRHLGRFWRFTIVSDGRRYYAFPHQGAADVPTGSPGDRVLSQERPTDFLVSLYDRIQKECEWRPEVVFDSGESNVVLYQKSVYLIPRSIGHVEIGPDEKIDHLDVVRLPAADFRHYFFACEADNYLSQWAEALSRPKDDAVAPQTELIGAEAPLCLSGKPADILAFVAQSAA